MAVRDVVLNTPPARCTTLRPRTKMGNMGKLVRSSSATSSTVDARQVAVRASLIVLCDRNTQGPGTMQPRTCPPPREASSTHTCGITSNGSRDKTLVLRHKWQA